MFQWVQNIFHKENDISEERLKENLMKRMVKNQSIPYDSKLYHEGIEQFDQNFEKLLKKYKKNNIPVFAGTLVSNLRGQEPLFSASDNANDIETELERADLLDSAGQIEFLEQLLKTDSTYAKVWFKLGNAHLKLGKIERARGCFIKAKEYDELRFRAPEKINQIIKEHTLASEHYLVSINKHLSAHDKLGIIGNELMTEHLHPNLRGYFYIADVFYNTLTTSDLLSNQIKTNNTNYAWKDSPVSIIDSLFGDYTVSVLKEGWPFYEPMPPIDENRIKSDFENIAGDLFINRLSWEQASDKLYKLNFNNGEPEKAAKILEATVLEYPYESVFSVKTAQLYHKLGQHN